MSVLVEFYLESKNKISMLVEVEEGADSRIGIKELVNSLLNDVREDGYIELSQCGDYVMINPEKIICIRAAEADDEE